MSTPTISCVVTVSWSQVAWENSSYVSCYVWSRHGFLQEFTCLATGQISRIFVRRTNDFLNFTTSLSFFFVFLRFLDKSGTLYYDSLFTLKMTGKKYDGNFPGKLTFMVSAFHQNLIVDSNAAHFFKLDCLFRYFLTCPCFEIFWSPGKVKIWLFDEILEKN